MSTTLNDKQPFNTEEFNDNCEITFACGHTGQLPDYVLPDMASNYSNWAASSRLCRSCWVEKEAAENAQFSAEKDLPALRGSEKQCAWANAIRRDMLTEIEDRIKLAKKLDRQEVVTRLTSTHDILRSVANALSWIDARHFSAEKFQRVLEASLKPKRAPRKQKS